MISRFGVASVAFALLLVSCASDEPTLPARFLESTARPGLPATGQTSGLVVLDWDEDGQLDVLVGRHSGFPEAYRNGGDFRFLPQPDWLPPVPGIDHHATAVGQASGDEVADLYFVIGAERGHGTGSNVLLLDKTIPYLSETGPSLADSLGRGRAAMFLDVIGSADLDLLVLNFKSSLRLYENLGPRGWKAQDGFFPHLSPDEDITLQSDPEHRARGYYATRFHPYDADRDGHLDGALIGGPPLVVLRRNEAGQLVPAYERLPADIYVPGPTTLAWGDLDHDSHPDLVLGYGKDAPITLRVLFGDGHAFREVLTAPTAPHGGVREIQLADVDNDGFLDVVLALVAANSVALLHNEGGREFSLESDALGLPTTLPGVVQGVLPVDLDGDGFLDLLCALGDHDQPEGPGGVALFQNQGGTLGDWIVMDLVTRENTPAYGARVRLTTQHGVQEHQHWPSQSAGSSMPLPLHAGLGRNAHLQPVEVTWPTGRVSRHDVKVNTRHRLQEPRDDSTEDPDG